MAPKVLVSDALSETAVQIFRDRGVAVDYIPDLGKDKEKLAEINGNYDGLAIRSATKVTEKLLDYVERTDAGGLVVPLCFGGMPADEATASTLQALHARLREGANAPVCNMANWRPSARRQPR